MSTKHAYHFIECPECESCFMVAKNVQAVPKHKCWAKDAERAAIAKATGEG